MKLPIPLQIVEKSEGNYNQKYQIYLRNSMCKSSMSPCYLQRNEVYKINMLFVKNGDFFFPNQVLMILKSTILPNRFVYISLPYGGKVDEFYFCKDEKIIYDEFVMSVIRVDDEKFLNNKIFFQKLNVLNDIEICNLIDDFSNDTYVFFSKVSGEDDKYFKFYLDPYFTLDFIGISFESINDKIFMIFSSKAAQFKIFKNDKIIFLSENKEKLELIFLNNSSYKDEFYFNSIVLTSEIVSYFSKNLLFKAKFMNSKSFDFCVCSLDNNFYEITSHNAKCQYMTKIQGQYLFHYMLTAFMKEVVK